MSACDISSSIHLVKAVATGPAERPRRRPRRRRRRRRRKVNKFARRAVGRPSGLIFIYSPHQPHCFASLRPAADVGAERVANAIVWPSCTVASRCVGKRRPRPHAGQVGRRAAGESFRPNQRIRAPPARLQSRPGAAPDPVHVDFTLSPLGLPHFCRPGTSWRRWRPVETSARVQPPRGVRALEGRGPLKGLHASGRAIESGTASRLAPSTCARMRGERVKFASSRSG